MSAMLPLFSVISGRHKLTEKLRNSPPVDRDEVYKEIFEQAENFKKYQGA